MIFNITDADIRKVWVFSARQAVRRTLARLPIGLQSRMLECSEYNPVAGGVPFLALDDFSDLDFRLKLNALTNSRSSKRDVIFITYTEPLLEKLLYTECPSTTALRSTLRFLDLVEVDQAGTVLILDTFDYSRLTLIQALEYFEFIEKRSPEL